MVGEPSTATIIARTTIAATAIVAATLLVALGRLDPAAFAALVGTAIGLVGGVGAAIGGKVSPPGEDSGRGHSSRLPAGRRR